MIEPYYNEDGITIYHADCRDVLPQLEPVDLVTVCDPPYGINVGANESAAETRAGFLVKGKYQSYEDSPENYKAVVVPVLSKLIPQTKRAAVFGFAPNIFLLPPPNVMGGIYVPAGCGRSCWGFTNFMPVLFYGTAPNLQKGAKPTVYRSTEIAEKNGHPTPKPISWMKWLVSLCADVSDVVLDPFMGSGTTLRAAKDLGLKAIGIEIERKYCDIAIERLRQQAFSFEAAS